VTTPSRPGDAVAGQLLAATPLARDYLAFHEAAINHPAVPRQHLDACESRYRSLLGRDQDSERPFGDGAPQAVLDFAERYLLDPHGLTDGQYAKVVELYGEDGPVALCLALGALEETLRLELLLPWLRDA
jgi:hypothetical protein